MTTGTVSSVGWVPSDDSFGARLALIRQRMGWNAKEAAIECGLPQQSWRNWEIGRQSIRNQEQTARKIAERTGCDYLWVFAGVRTPAPAPPRQDNSDVIPGYSPPKHTPLTSKHQRTALRQKQLAVTPWMPPTQNISRHAA